MEQTSLNNVALLYDHYREVNLKYLKFQNTYIEKFVKQLEKLSSQPKYYWNTLINFFEILCIIH